MAHHFILHMKGTTFPANVQSVLFLNANRHLAHNLMIHTLFEVEHTWFSLFVSKQAVLTTSTETSSRSILISEEKNKQWQTGDTEWG